MLLLEPVFPVLSLATCKPLHVHCSSVIPSAITAMLSPHRGIRYVPTMHPHPNTIAISDLDDQLLLRRTAPDDYVVEVAHTTKGRLPVGRIMRVMRASQRIAWSWSLVGPYAAEAKVTTIGEAADREEAKVALRAAYDTVLRWAAAERGGALVWHIGVDRADPSEV